MKKIAIVIDSLVGGGAEKVMLTLSKALVSLGHSVTLLSLNPKNDYNIPENVNHYHLFDGKISKVDAIFSIKKNVIKLQNWFSTYQKEHGLFDIILSNLDKSNNLIAQSNLSNVYYIIHNSINEELSRQKKLGPFAYYYLYRSKQRLNGKNLICVSKGIEMEILNKTTITPKSISTIYNPFDFSEIVNKSNQSNSLIPHEPYIIHVGRLAKQKRHDILFEALKNVNQAYKLVLLCNKPQKAIKLAKKFGIEKRLVLPGFQKNPYNWIKHAKVLVLSSDYEGLPTVLIEALACNTLTVSTACPHGPDEILTGELTKFLVSRRDPKALSCAINNAIESNFLPEKVDILTQTKYQNVAQKYLNLC